MSLLRVIRDRNQAAADQAAEQQPRPKSFREQLNDKIRARIKAGR